jgi:cell division protein FtsB
MLYDMAGESGFIEVAKNCTVARDGYWLPTTSFETLVKERRGLEVRVTELERENKRLQEAYDTLDEKARRVLSRAEGALDVCQNVAEESSVWWKDAAKIGGAFLIGGVIGSL